MSVRKIAMGIAALAAACAFAAPPGSTMSLTLEDGNEVVLQPDSTWNYAKPGILATDSNDDVFITLKDNRILWLKPDYTWTFTKQQPKANKIKEFPPLSVVGAATKPALDAAVKAATDDAYTKATANLRKLLPTNLPKNALAYLTACIKDEVKENDIEIVYNPGWKAEAKIAIPNYRVKKIMDCLDLQLTPEPAK